MTGSKFKRNNNNNSNGNGAQPQQRATIATTGPSQMVQQMAAQNFAMRNGGMMPPTMQGAPNGNIPPVAPAPAMNFFQGGNQAVGKYDAQPAQPMQQAQAAQVGQQPMQQAQPMQQPIQTGAVPTTDEKPQEFEAPSLQENGDVGYKGGPYDPSKYDSLSAALNGSGGDSSMPQQAQFHADPNQKDGGFFGWLKGLMPKRRPGMREGETPDEYDRRTTRNMEMLATLTDAIRHMGNIVYTAKGAPVQQFNDPTTMMEQGYQQRKADRQKQAAMDADAAYKMANMSIKERAAEAAEAYKKLTLGYRDAADRRAQAQFEYQQRRDADADQYKRDKDQRDFEHKKEREKVQDTKDNKRLEIAEYNATHKGSGRGGGGRSGKGGSGSGGKYWFEDKNGKMHYQPNKTMWEQEYYREYGKLPYGESNTSTSTKTYDPKTGAEVTTTTRRKGASMTSQAAAAQVAAQNARKRAAAAKAKGKSGGGGGNGHNALNAWFKKNNK